MSASFDDLSALATHLRQELVTKKFVLLYAYNGTGKTRLSTAFKDLGKRTVTSPLTTEDGEPLLTEGATVEGDTLYYNAFTEDLFSWDNDLDGDSERRLKINSASRFFAGLAEIEMDNRIRPFLGRYADFDFRIDTDAWFVRFSRRLPNPEYDESAESPDRERTIIADNIKVSRGEENIFIWCFFLAVVQLAMDGAEAYRWVKYVYIDDPISSLDEHNAIVVANHLVQLFRETPNRLKTVISTHHNLFFNVLHYELKNYFLKKYSQYVLSRNRSVPGYRLREQKGDTPAFHHVAALAELNRVAVGDTIETFHFNMLRTVLEKTALFHGYGHFSHCIKRDPNDADGILHQRFIDLLSHGKYSLYEPQAMGDETKEYFRRILRAFLERYPFNPALFPPPSPPPRPTPP